MLTIVHTVNDSRRSARSRRAPRSRAHKDLKYLDVVSCEMCVPDLRTRTKLKRQKSLNSDLETGKTER